MAMPPPLLKTLLDKPNAAWRQSSLIPRLQNNDIRQFWCKEAALIRFNRTFQDQKACDPCPVLSFPSTKTNLLEHNVLCNAPLRVHLNEPYGMNGATLDIVRKDIALSDVTPWKHATAIPSLRCVADSPTPDVNIDCSLGPAWMPVPKANLTWGGLVCI
jgi:hypothetical protein